MATLNSLLNILKVALGLGFVIFLHELGHFLLAKWNGVKVEKFSIGFGRTILGFTKGETEYVLAAIPLGGFVKMLGEGPDDEASKSSDPRAYPNKSVGARMAIISAGVIMNLFLGLGCFVYSYKAGMIELPTKVGAVIPGGPAYEAGLSPGDEIVAINGRPDPSFTFLQLKVRLSGQGQSVHFEIKRPGLEAPIPLDIEPRREDNADMPGIGIAPSLGLELALPPYLAPPGLEAPANEVLATLKTDDKVVAAGPVGEEPKPYTEVQDFYRMLARHAADPIALLLKRPVLGKDGKALAPQDVRVTLPPNRFVDFGFRLKIEPIAGVRGGSPADRAGFRKGDTIVKVDGKSDFDPMQFPSYCFDHAGQSITIEVERPVAGGSPEVVSLMVTPEDAPPWTEYAVSGAPLDVPGLGLAYNLRTKIEAVTPDSPAARAGLKVGDVINSITLPSLKPVGETKPLVIKLDDKSRNWSFAFQQLQFRPLAPITLRVNNGSVPVVITPEPVAKWFHPVRGEKFQGLTRTIPPQTVPEALRRGFDDTVDNIMSIYAMFRSLAQRRVSPKGLAGPIGIAQVAYTAAGLGVTELVHFLGLLSINLAVLNFLPVPPLDGGQMVFLIAEKVRGRPLPDSAVIAGTYFGLILVLCLMLFVIFQDVSRLVIGSF